MTARWWLRVRSRFRRRNPLTLAGAVEAQRLLDELFHAWLLDLESVSYSVITIPKGQKQ